MKPFKTFQEDLVLPSEDFHVKAFFFANDPKKHGGFNFSGKKGSLFVPFPSKSFFFSLKEEEKSKKILSLVSTKKDELTLFSKKVDQAMKSVVYGGFSEKLLFHGVGFRVELKESFEDSKAKQLLSLHCGFSHPVVVPVPKNLAVAVPKQTTLLVSGLSKHSVQAFVSYLEKIPRKDPYKGKGIRKEKNTLVILKEKKKK